MGLGDNTSAVSWLFRASLPTQSFYQKAVSFIARTVAMRVSASKNFIVSRHLEGRRNVICDYLSFKGKDRNFKKKRTINGVTTFVEKIAVNPIAYERPPNDVVTNRILSSFPQLVPRGFKISHLPTDVLSFVQEAAEILESSFIRAQKEETKRMTVVWIL